MHGDQIGHRSLFHPFGGCAKASLKSFIAGAAAMYFLDPQQGNRRRSVARDKLIRAARKSADGLEMAGRDLSNRIDGLLAEARHLFGREAVSDAVVRERVRSALGRAVSHPGAIQVAVRDGRAVLGGPILSSEVEHLLHAVRQVRGVRGVENKLEAHDSAGGIPALQGEGLRSGKPVGMMRRQWPPAMRLMAGTVGGGLALRGLARRDLLSIGLGAGGLGLFMRTTTNRHPIRALAQTTADLSRNAERATAAAVKKK